MCGIAGAAWTSSGRPLSEDTLRRMTDSLRHRGPDDDGCYFSPGASRAAPAAALGFRRLSIIDLQGGHQPLSNEAGDVWIVFNGEIYNYRELRPVLEAAGHVFRTHSDTETIVHLYEQYGLDFVAHLRGMFALAIWDERSHRLVLARDRIGQKPLFFRHDSDRLCFASEVKALLQVPDAPRELDPQAIEHYLTYQYVPHPQCVLKGYSKLPPAHLAIYEGGRLQTRRYWLPPYCTAHQQPLADRALADCDRWSDDDWRQNLRRSLTEAVRLRMRSDVPLGAFLSGGIDSTIITGLMQSLSDRPVHTFSIGFPVPQFDERRFARDAARHLGTEHHEFVVEPSALDILPRLIWHYDEPFGDSSAIPTMALCELTRREVTVALSGDGGDELFGGYNRYFAVRLASRIDRLPRFVRRICAWPLWQRIPASVEQQSLRRRARRFLAALGQSPELRYLRWIGIFDDDWRMRLYTPGFRERLGSLDAAGFIESAYAHCCGPDIVTRTMCADVHSYLPCDILTKVDIASMAYGLEARSPFLDHHVAELAARMPVRLKQQGAHGKVILKETFADLLPPSIQSRGKMGFGVPLDHWFRGQLRPLVRDTLLSRKAIDRGFFNPAAVERLITEHEREVFDHSSRLWLLLVLEEWCRAFLDPPQPPTGPLPRA
jgi:asparagine synthase (glutamine-hydrolysing)